MGDPLLISNAEIIFESMGGVQVKASVIPNLEPGVNYNLTVPMDAGVTSDAYKPTALRPTVPFKMKVRIGQTTWLPIEMSGDFRQLGQPSKRTRLNLTLGEDADGDGLPDAWERAMIALTGGTNTLAGIRPGDDFDKDGLSNLNEYYAGTYAFDPEDGFVLDLVNVATNGVALMEFLGIRGRTYSVQSSTDLRQWQRVPFRLPAQGATAPLVWTYQAADVRTVQVEISAESGQQPQRYFRLMLE